MGDRVDQLLDEHDQQHAERDAPGRHRTAPSASARGTAVLERAFERRSSIGRWYLRHYLLRDVNLFGGLKGGQALFDRGERILGARAVGTAGLRHVGAAAAALAAERFRAARTRSTALMRAVRSSVTPTTSEALAVGDGDEGDDTRAELRLRVVGERLQILGRRRPRPRAARSSRRRSRARVRRRCLARTGQRERLAARRRVRARDGGVPRRAPRCGRAIPRARS